MSDRLPAGISYLGGLEASVGTATYAGGVVSWVGDISPAAPMTVRFQALVSPDLEGALLITNWALLEDGEGRT